MLAWFSLDDIIQAHERVSGKLDVFESLPSYVRTRLWLPVYLPLLAVAGYLLLRAVARTLLPGRRVSSGPACCCSCVGIAFEVVGLSTKWLARRDVVWPDDIRIGLEEGIELSGWIAGGDGADRRGAFSLAWASRRRAGAEGHEPAARSQPPAATGKRERGSLPRRGRER